MKRCQQTVLVEESDIAEAMRVLQQRCGVTAEGSGAVGVAAVLSKRISLQGPSVLVISGGTSTASGWPMY